MNLSIKKKNEQKKNERKCANQFQTFLLKDILLFAQSKNTIPSTKECNVDSICSIRNIIAHSKNITNSSKDGESIIFDIHGLKEFVSQIKIVEKLYRYLEKNI